MTPRTVAAVLLALVLAVLWVGSRFDRPHARVAAAGEVVHVVDGDTITVAGVEGNVRLLLIDAPETHDNSHGPKGCYGITAKDFVAGLLPAGTHVELVTDGRDRDRYGRLLAYVEAGDVDVGAEVLRRGFAEVYDDTVKRSRRDRYEKIKAQAERDRLGIWGPACAP